MELLLPAEQEDAVDEPFVCSRRSQCCKAITAAAKRLRYPQKNPTKPPELEVHSRAGDSTSLMVQEQLGRQTERTNASLRIHCLMASINSSFIVNVTQSLSTS
jgi:hypothetical protein